MPESSFAMVLEAFNKPLVGRELEIPVLTDGQVLVRITAAGICGSDVHMWTGKDPRTPLPMILGHEGVGEVVQIQGKRRSVDGERLKEGDPILWNRGVVCGHCYWCTRAGQPWLCPERWVYGIHRSIHQPTYLNGCYSTYVVLDAKTDLFPLRGNGLDASALVPASCSGATVAHAFDLYPPKGGDTVLVQGPGPLGIFAIAFAEDAGAGDIIVIGGTRERLDLCRAFGATLVLNRRELSMEQRKEAVMEVTDGRGVDVTYEAVGHPEAVKEGMALTRRGGSYLSMGFGAPTGSVVLDVYHDLEIRDLRLQGIWVSHTKHTRMALELILKHRDLFRRLITHRFLLCQATEALGVVEQKASVKAILVPDSV